MRIQLITAAVANGISEPIQVSLHDMTFQFTLGGTGTGSAAVTIEVSNDGKNFKSLYGDSQPLTKTDANADVAFWFDTISESWAFVRATISDFTLTTGAITANVDMGIS